MTTLAFFCAIGVSFLLGLILGIRLGEDLAIEASAEMIRDGRLHVDENAVALAKKIRGQN